MKTQKNSAEEAKKVEDKIDAVETLQEVGQQVAAQEFQSTINKSLDETKKNVRKSIDESRNQIPQYANVVKNYQEQALESTGKMVEDYVEAQKSVMNAVFNSANPYYENANRVFSYWFSPRVSAEIYARLVSNIVENVSASDQNTVTTSYLEILKPWETISNGLNDTQKSLRGSMLIQQKPLKIQQEKRQLEFSVNRQREVYR